MIPVAGNHSVQRFGAAVSGLSRQLVPVGDLVPDQQACLVCRLKITRTGHLDMAAEQVQSQLLGEAHLRPQLFEGWLAVEGLRIKGLVERPANVEQLAVEKELAI